MIGLMKQNIGMCKKMYINYYNFTFNTQLQQTFKTIWSMRLLSQKTNSTFLPLEVVSIPLIILPKLKKRTVLFNNDLYRFHNNSVNSVKRVIVL